MVQPRHDLTVPRRAAFGGLAAGFGGTLVIGAVVGAIAGFALDGPQGALFASIASAVLVGMSCALPAAILAMIECWLLALLLQRIDASPSASKTAFIALGAISGPLMSIAAFVIYGSGIDGWVWPTAAVVATAGGARAGFVVWQIASLQHTRRWMVPVKKLHSPPSGV